MAYQRMETSDGITRMSKALYDNLQDGIDEALQIKTYVTPQMFGAKGDGVTDDTEAFKECFKHTNIFIPAGTYIINETIEVLNKTNICGNTRESTTIQSTSDIVFNAQGFVYFANLQIKGDGTNIGIQFPYRYLRLTNVGMVSLNIGVMSIDKNTIMFNSFVGCRFYYTNHPFNFESSTGQVNTTIISDCIFAVYKTVITAPYLYGLCFDRCTFEGDNTDYICDVSGTYSLSFHSCYVESDGELFSTRWFVGNVIIRDTWIYKNNKFISQKQNTSYTRKITLDGCHIINSDSDENTFEILMDGTNIILDFVNCITKLGTNIADEIEILNQDIASKYGVAVNCIVNSGHLTLNTLPLYNGEVE